MTGIRPIDMATVNRIWRAYNLPELDEIVSEVILTYLGKDIHLTPQACYWECKQKCSEKKCLNDFHCCFEVWRKTIGL